VKVRELEKAIHGLREKAMETKDLMLVGHLPFLEKLASFLICGDEVGKGSLVSIQRHLVFGKERARKMGGRLVFQIGNSLR
jgi:phosphohistidine phosphatase SixA